MRCQNYGNSAEFSSLKSDQHYALAVVSVKEFRSMKFVSTCSNGECKGS